MISLYSMTFTGIIGILLALQKMWLDLQRTTSCPSLRHFAEEQILWKFFTSTSTNLPPKEYSFIIRLRDSTYYLRSWISTACSRGDYPCLCLICGAALLMVYLTCLTEPSDKLVAFSRLTRLYQDLTGYECLAG